MSSCLATGSRKATRSQRRVGVRVGVGVGVGVGGFKPFLLLLLLLLVPSSSRPLPAMYQPRRSNEIPPEVRPWADVIVRRPLLPLLDPVDLVPVGEPA